MVEGAEIASLFPELKNYPFGLGLVLALQASPSFAILLSLTNVSELMRVYFYQRTLFNRKVFCEFAEFLHHRYQLFIILFQSLFVSNPFHHKIQ